MFAVFVDFECEVDEWLRVVVVELESVFVGFALDESVLALESVLGDFDEPVFDALLPVEFDFADFDVVDGFGRELSSALAPSPFGGDFTAGLSSAGIGSGSARATLAEQARAIASPSRRVTPKL